MTNADIQKIRQLLKEIRKNGGEIDPEGLHRDAVISIHNAQIWEIFKLSARILALLPCETCGGTGKSLEYAKACLECSCAEYVNKNLLGENYRECKKCGQDWWLQIKYGIGDKPCPDCQNK